MKYRCIVADPPWEYPEGFVTQSNSKQWRGETKQYELPYPSMSVAEIKALPVADLADTDCRLWLWATNRYLDQAFGVLKAWGFTYRQTLVWHKSDGNMGGSVSPNSAEYLLVGVKGTPGVEKKWASSVVKLAQHKVHSKKPVEFLYLIERANKGPYIELFARQKRVGWHTWGNQVPCDVELEAK